jgi:hypothetical protein
VPLSALSGGSVLECCECGGLDNQVVLLWVLRSPHISSRLLEILSGDMSFWISEDSMSSAAKPAINRSFRAP